MRNLFWRLLLTALLAGAGCAPLPRPTAASSALRPPPSTWPGQQPDGSVLLPNQWSLRPVGRQVELADFPINVAVHPGGRFAAVLHTGYSAHQILRLPNDHTQGATRGARTPTALVADNDLALGQLVEAVSHSKFWPQTAIFVVEDDD